MAVPKERISYLLGAWTNRKATPEEERELFEWVIGTKTEELVEIHIQQLVKQHTGKEPVPAVDWEGLYERILQNRQAEEITAKVRRMPAIRRIAVAASIIFTMAMGSYFLFFNHHGQSTVAKNNAEEIKDVKAPTANRAMITLANGEKVYLDSATNGSLAMQGTVQVLKLADGRIVYHETQKNGHEISYNTLTNPRCSRVIDMTLTDGSRVWLNAGSSITYPVAIMGKERKVEITGEAYFVVSHNEKMPFKVIANGTQIEDLGTEFNINSYADEDDLRATLISGLIEVSKGSAKQLLKPGQQARIASDIKIVNDVDLEAVLAWKNGRFELGGNTIEPIMRQVARWYDVEIEYRGPKPTDNFMGGMSRQENVSELLKMIEQTNAVKFTIEGRKIVVSK